ncbi:hypothetical protein [Runella sp. SP2]|uniref:hypothetical protein n=1 Tax=Runella sp. SP2 TaxID=2268026 RepID=UPI000F0908EA|nr:hypothetical protein [Runella sp. SP2]AYQ31940.1 hypothetical protein DTQ70_07045 [Runella sp. SP2]
MKAFYYSLLLKKLLVRMPNGTSSRFYIIYFLLSLICVGQTAKAQFGSDLGAPAVSTLAWDHVSSVGDESSSAGSIGLTTDGKMYLWGTNICYTIHAQQTGSGNFAVAVFQTTPYYLPSPSGETIVKVRLMTNKAIGFYVPTYFALSQSGKLYAWGINNGLVGTVSNWPNVNNALPATSDTTKAIRSPRQLTILGESSFVEFDASPINECWVAIGASGKAYHIGSTGDAGSSSLGRTTTFGTIPNPAGVGAGFKYVKVWVSKTVGFPLIYLKGNDGNIYYTGPMGVTYYSGVPSAYVGTPYTNAELRGQVQTITPRLVPFPAGEDINDIYAQSYSGQTYISTYAVSASGKAYLAGGWRFFKGPYATNWTTYVVAPLKSEPTTATGLDVVIANASDSVYILKSFREVAMPPGASKVLHFEGFAPINGDRMLVSIIVGDNNKVYWSGYYNNNQGYIDTHVANYLEPNRSSAPPSDWSYTCGFNYRFAANDYYKWNFEAINYRGAVRVQITNLRSVYFTQQLFILSKTKRGYFVGPLFPNTGTGRTAYLNTPYISPFPVPIANELLLSCNTSPGSGGPLGEPESTPGVGVIDCSKTKLYPAPVQGTPSQLSLLVTINVTTIGDFSPITINGSGMSLVSGFDKVTATTTGVQTFHIPIKYDGTTLTNALQFTIGQAGSCAADLTKTPTKAITDIWTLECVPSAGPSLKK